MPPIEVDLLFQKAIYREKTGENEYNEPVFSAAAELNVRWIDGITEMAGPDGIPIALDATVIVDQAVKVGSLMWKGTLSDWLGTGSSDEDERDEMVVMLYKETPDIDNRDIRRRLGLQRFRDTING